MGSKGWTPVDDTQGWTPVNEPGRTPAPVATGQNPVQDMKSQLASAWQTALGGYPAEIASGIGRGATNTYEALGNLLRPRNPNEVQYGPTGRALLHLGQDVGGGLVNAYQASSQARDSGEGLAGQALAFGENAPIIGGMVRHAESGGTKMFNPQSVGAAAEGATYAAVPKVAEDVLTSAVKGPLDALQAKKISSLAGNEGVRFKAALQSTSHDILTNAAKSGIQKLWDANNKVGQRVRALKNDIVASDVAAGEPAISISELWPRMDELATNFKAAGGKLPKFDAAVDAIFKRKDALGVQKEVLTMDEAMNLRSEIGDLWSKAAEGTRDAGAVRELRDALTDKISQRADDLGHAKTFEAYNKLWSTLQKYKQQGALGDLLNAPRGKEFFDTLTNPKYGAELQRTFDDLQKFGLKKNFKGDLLAQQGDVYRYVKNADPNIGFGGRMKAIVRHPVAGTLGAMGGATVGSVIPGVGTMIGGGMGAIKAADLAETLRGIRAVREAGGIPERSGLMGDATQVMPSGKTPEEAEFDDRVSKAAALRDAKDQ